MLVPHLKNVSISKVETVTYAFCIFFLMNPFYLWHSNSSSLFILIASIISIRKIRKPTKKQAVFSILFFLIYLYVVITVNLNLYGSISVLLLCLLPLLSGIFLNDVFEFFRKIISIFLIPSLLTYILINIIGIDLPHSTITSINDIKDYDYSKYLFLVQDIDPFTIFPRFCAYYDEPGVVGTLTSVLLLISRFNLKKWVNLPIFIAGIFSFSLVFNIVLIIYFLLFFKNKYKIIVALILLPFIPLIVKNEAINELIFLRFQIADNKLSGDQRTTKEYDEAYARFQKTDKFYFGDKDNDFVSNSGTSTYKNLIVLYGLIPFIIYVTMFVYYGYLKFRLKKDFLIYILILVSVLYQRPYITSLYYVFLLYVPLVILKRDKLPITSLVTNTHDENAHLIIL